ncbi:hypothetical protein PM082_023675 [Marasmius tenuissimus]|nr:hypothetical protein PM082_023675 [Marasmius tenuissimus]
MKFLLSILTLAGAIHGKIIYGGVNEVSGGEFGSQNLPGAFGIDYAFINKSAVDVFVDQEKINLFRVTFLMERMCPLETGLGSTFNETASDNLWKKLSGTNTLNAMLSISTSMQTPSTTSQWKKGRRQTEIVPSDPSLSLSAEALSVTPPIQPPPPPSNSESSGLSSLEDSLTTQSHLRDKQ